MRPRRKDITVALVLVLLAVHAVRSGGVPSLSGGVYTVIARESADDNHQFGQFILSLRTGSAGEYFSQGGRRLYVLDDDGTDEKGSQVIPADELKDVTLPVQLGYTKDWKRIAAKTLPKNPTSQAVIDTARGYGG